MGNHALDVIVGNNINLNQLPPADLAMGQVALFADVTSPFYGLAAVAGSSCGIDQPQVSAFQLMLPMPQYSESVQSYSPIAGVSMYDALNMKYTHPQKI